MAIQDEAKAKQAARIAASVRTAELADAAAIWRLVHQSEALDTNSCYAYLLLCSDFSDTCLVAYDDDQLAGFVAGYVPPKRPGVVFVWQIGVAPPYRGCGVARELLSQLVDRAAAKGANYLEATVTPSNQPSRRLFSSLAEKRGWQLTTTGHLEAHHFADPQHEEESLIRIGPFPRGANR